MKRLERSDAEARVATLPGWSLVGDKIQKSYALVSFAESMAFVNRVAALAEGVDHHPDILVQYTRVTLTLSTHDAAGLTARDFDLASRIDAPA